MKKETFDWFICVTSAPLAGIGAAQLNYGSIGWGMVCTALSIKLIVSYFRTPPEMFEKGHLPHAINIPQTAIRNNLSSIPQDKPVVLYCNRSIRAYVAAALLNNRGFDNIYVLSGGLYLYNEIEQNLREQNQTEAEY